tara:strand:- start:880 stop:1086 length:207 start_codon:yes stop_codon:yes gene_type:complete
MTEKTYRVKVYRTVHQRAFVEVCTDIDPEGQDFYDVIDEEVFQLEDNEWDTIETDGSGFFDILNAKVV